MEPALRVDVLAADPQPDLGHPLHARPGGVGGEPDPVDGADRRAVDAVGHEPVLGQDLEHADLDGAAGAAAGEDQGGQRLLVLLVVPVAFVPVAVAVVHGGPSALLRPASGPGTSAAWRTTKRRVSTTSTTAATTNRREDDGEGGSWPRGSSRAEATGRPGGRTGRVTPSGHTVDMTTTAPPTGVRHDGNRGSHGGGVGRDRSAGSGGGPLAGAALLDRLPGDGTGPTPGGPRPGRRPAAHLECGPGTSGRGTGRTGRHRHCWSPREGSPGSWPAATTPPAADPTQTGTRSRWPAVPWSRSCSASW